MVVVVPAIVMAAQRNVPKIQVQREEALRVAEKAYHQADAELTRIAREELDEAIAKREKFNCSRLVRLIPLFKQSTDRDVVAAYLARHRKSLGFVLSDEHELHKLHLIGVRRVALDLRNEARYGSTPELTLTEGTWRSLSRFAD